MTFPANTTFRVVQQKHRSSYIVQVQEPDAMLTSISGFNSWMKAEQWIEKERAKIHKVTEKV